MAKPVIINGVDVSKCEHLVRDDIDCDAYIDFSECCEGYDWSYGYCPNIPNCHFKQLERIKKIIKENCTNKEIKDRIDEVLND